MRDAGPTNPSNQAGVRVVRIQEVQALSLGSRVRPDC
jgi:hypothetical protein